MCESKTFYKNFDFFALCHHYIKIFFICKHYKENLCMILSLYNCNCIIINMFIEKKNSYKFFLELYKYIKNMIWQICMNFLNLT